MNDIELNDFLQNLPSLVQHKSLAIYRLPNSTETHIVIGDAQEIKSLAEVLASDGFAFLPSEGSPQYKPFLILPEQQWQLTDTNSLLLLELKVPFSSIPPIISSQSDYLVQAQSIVDATQAGEAEKAILSRIKTQPISDFNPGLTFQKLCDTYSTVMVYWVSIPGVGTWLGATPETLIKLDGGVAETIALAGTQAETGLALEKVTWGQKELREQQIVSDNIEGLIREYFPAEKIYIDGPNTTSTGALLHLRTTYRWHIPQDVSALESFLLSLHPTPAIAGHPKEAALDLIAKIEPHERAYYTGLLGPVNRHGLTHLFVNLRCMQVFDGQLALYLGGGITAASDPMAEWHETELKAQTLLRVV
ncbi:isochorismate synthase [soil metagenome]